jgi:hypothetical protein
MKHRWAEPDIEDQYPFQAQMPTGRSQCSKYVGIPQLISEDGKHHQGSIKLLLQVNAANVSLVECYRVAS